MLDQSGFDAKEQVRQAIDIVDLVGSYLPLRREGRNFKALCPWHNDSRPSLQVNPTRQSFKCWVCDIGGDIFSFLMKMEGVEFGEALEMLAERAGIKLVRQKGSGQHTDDRKTLFQIMAWAEDQFHKFLMQSPEAEIARRFYDERGLTEESLAKYRLGFSPDSWDWLIKRAANQNFAPAMLEKVGLVIPRSEGKEGFYDRFRGRALFPIRDAQGRTIAFGGRVLPQFADNNQAKYINSPETPLFSKHKTLYGLDSARDVITKSRTALVMEGYTDCLMARQFGVDNAVAVLGTALGEQHLHQLRQYCDRVVLVLDGDEAGQRRTNEILELFINEPIDLRVLTLPEGLDPCDFLIERGSEAFPQLQSSAVDALEHAFQTFTRGIDANSNPHEATRAIERLLTILAKPSQTQSAKSQERTLRESLIVTRLARRFDMRDDVISKRLTEMRRAAAKAVRTPTQGNAKSEANESLSVQIVPLTQWQALERELLELILLEPECVKAVSEVLTANDLPTETARSLFELIVNIANNGQTPDFSTLMNSLSDERMKSLLVNLDERAQVMANAEEPVERLRKFTDRWTRERMDRQQGTLIQRLRHEAHQDDAELLKHIFEQERVKRGIS